MSGSTGVTLCEVFRSPRREGVYLYVKREEGLDRVPDALLTQFGEPESALVFRLTPERKLAQANATDVLDALAKQGFYLQMPPAGDSEESDEGSAARTRSVAESEPGSEHTERQEGSHRQC